LNNNSVFRKSEAATESLVKANQENLSETREKMLAVLKMIMNGDQLAAEYLILCLLAKVHTRKDSFILGNLCLNLCNVGFF
jgi:hypothetical protein